MSLLDPSFVGVVVIVNIDGVVNPQIGDIDAGQADDFQIVICCHTGR